MAQITYATALHQVLIELMQQDERVMVFGEFKPPTEGQAMGQVFGSDRVIDVPVSEMAYCGAALGAALAGMRPIVTFGYAGFMFNAWEQVVNEAPMFRYMSGGQVTVPVVLHCIGGARGAGAAQHSHSPQAMLWNTPGLKVILPATPADLKGLLRTAVADPGPVMFVDHDQLYAMHGPDEEAKEAIPFGRAEVRRQGEHVTIVATSHMVHRALQAAEELSGEEIEAEVIDPRTLAPFDEAAVLASVKKTGRLVVADETHKSCGVAAEIAARVAHAGFAYLKAPIGRVATADVPIPYSTPLEARVVPGPAAIVQAAREVARYGQ